MRSVRSAEVRAAVPVMVLATTTMSFDIRALDSAGKLAKTLALRVCDKPDEGWKSSVNYKHGSGKVRKVHVDGKCHREEYYVFPQFVLEGVKQEKGAGTLRSI